MGISWLVDARGCQNLFVGGCCFSSSLAAFLSASAYDTVAT